MGYEELKEELRADMLNIYHECMRKHNYKPNVFFARVNSDGPIRTAMSLMMSPYPSLGFEKLWEYGDLDLTVEALILNSPKYHELFSSDQIEYCKEKMKKYGYFPQGVTSAEEDIEAITGQTLRELAKKVEGRTVKKRQEVEVFERNPFVSKCAREHANGVCELCGAEAPFKDTKGRPFLEVHHVDWLSTGGKDSIDNTVALCPNCHRKMHVLDRAVDRTVLKKRIAARG